MVLVVMKYLIPCFLKSYIWQNLTFVYDFSFVAIGCFPYRISLGNINCYDIYFCTLTPFNAVICKQEVLASPSSPKSKVKTGSVII